MHHDPRATLSQVRLVVNVCFRDEQQTVNVGDLLYAMPAYHSITAKAYIDTCDDVLR